jgi:hypothetical protein
MDYSNLLKRAATIVWQNKFLWLLGFLAALGGNSVSNSGSSNFNFPADFGGGSGGSGTTDAEIEAFINQLEQGGDPLSAMPDYLAGAVGVVFLLICGLFLFFIAMWFVRQVAEAGMIQAVFNIEAGQPMTFGEAMSHGLDSLWRYVAVNALLKWLPGLLFGVLGLGFALAILGTAVNEPNEEAILGMVGLMFACLAPLFCLYFPYSIWVTLVYPFAQRGITLHDLGVVESIQHGWRTLRTNFTPIFLLGILFVAISFVVGIVLLFIYVPILFVTFVPIIFNLINEETVSTSSMIIAGFGFLLIIMVGVLINAVLVAYRSTVFTLAYAEFMDADKLADKA